MTQRDESRWPHTAGLVRWLIDLDEIAAGVGKHGNRNRAGLRRLDAEHDTVRLEPPVFFIEVRNLESSQRYALLEHRFLERLARRIGIRFKCEFDIRIPIR